MYRQAIEKLVEWKNSPRRKPLIIEGARQVGKTWLVKEFASKYYANFIYVNFEDDETLRSLFKSDYRIERIIEDLEAAKQTKIDPDSTLIFLDEIQEAEKGITVLKYFNENAPHLHVIAAGSLLGVLLHQKISFPVGKVQFLKLYPLNYIEFLYALGEERLAGLIAERKWDRVNLFSERFIRYLKQYMYVGGMPEVVKTFVETKDWGIVREIQSDILNSYDNDFSKHIPANLVPRIRQVWYSLPAQLAKENRKFIYGIIREGARAKEYELAIQWLIDSGLIHKVCDVSAPRLPLAGYMEQSIFKIYCNDVGLLARMSELDSKTIIEGNALFVEFKGALTEQFVFQQMLQAFKLYYWSKPNSQQKIDFLIQKEGEVVPVEIKAGENLQAKSLKQFIKENDSRRAYRISLADYREEERIANIPLYGVSTIKDDYEA